MLPKHIGLIFLSATIPNTYEFAEYFILIKKKKKKKKKKKLDR
jgi:superfamily II RNA helicase